MRDRQLGKIKRSTARSIRFAMTSSRLRPLLMWCLAVLGINVALLGVTVALLFKDLHFSPPASYASAPTAAMMETVSQAEFEASGALPSELGPRHQLAYQDWVDLLRQEADAVANDPPEHLNVLMGDSLSLWFPHQLLPLGKTWLNQGISGEISAGLLDRLDAIANTQPDAIFVLIGINDLIRGVEDETILANQRLILQDLQAMHPTASIVVQSILPHAAEQATWEGKEKLLGIPNTRIQNLNDRLQIMTREEGANFLNLYPLFTDENGNLNVSLTTDGLHLNDQGYLVWRSALQLFSQLELDDA